MPKAWFGESGLKTGCAARAVSPPGPAEGAQHLERRERSVPRVGMSSFDAYRTCAVAASGGRPQRKRRPLDLEIGLALHAARRRRVREGGAKPPLPRSCKGGRPRSQPL